MANWDDLRVFLAVARSGSLSLAGKDLRMDPATVGRKVNRLEAAQDVTLFSKSPKGYALTEAGQGLLAHVEQADSALIVGLGGLSGQSLGVSGQIRIGAPDGISNFILPKVCADITRDFPDLDIQIVALPRVLNLNRREVDLAIGVSQPTAGRLIVQRIVDYHLHLAGAKTLLYRHPELTRLDQLQDFPIVGYIPDMIFDKELDYLSDIGVRRVQLASNSVSVQLNLLRQGIGLGVVHDFALPFAPELRPVLTQQLALKRAFWLIRPEEDRNNRRLNQFADILTKAVRAEVGRLERMMP